MMMNTLLDRPLAKVLWDYNQLNKPMRRSDFIFVMCSYNLTVAEHAYILFRQKMGDLSFYRVALRIKGIWLKHRGMSLRPLCLETE